ncbi:oxidoreductase [Streptomyces pluripotens]|uniref:Oxidoreductase n=1 Tax=Streptomyces pluripotens TaxID=1355015 RepID=A0A221NSC8_9ACTN|nr:MULTISPECIES: FAD/NAD(P)-binding protein [Streptomyces]ARP68644.1 oxidoreductase [Streptomyces pluripotens]ASN22903.1 oxidoreductase [Streptomyces pluripotens]KIE26721.1 oxidoreductase [Streptomyces sp. MUSC 125]MCH0559265.1 FAD/NAD(P)-binding protein [Streptomyces sp. MUM 16J]
MSTVTPPLPYRVVTTCAETADTRSVELVPAGREVPPFAPGQFAMIYAFGVGEVPVSVSALRGPHGGLVHTVRAVGAVSTALCRLRAGDVVGLSGPFGTGWDLNAARGWDVLVVAGGIGLAPLRPVVHSVLQRPGAFGRLAILVGARTPDDLIYRAETGTWRGAARVEVTVDQPGPGWHGSVGVVTGLLDRLDLQPRRTCALVCGPEAMIRHTARALTGRGLAPDRIQVSLERNMRCATGHCGHCQLGPLLLCRDGPVIGYDSAEPLLAVREL